MTKRSGEQRKFQNEQSPPRRRGSAKTCPKNVCDPGGARSECVAFRHQSKKYFLKTKTISHPRVNGVSSSSSACSLIAVDLCLSCGRDAFGCQYKSTNRLQWRMPSQCTGAKLHRIQHTMWRWFSKRDNVLLLSHL